MQGQEGNGKGRLQRIPTAACARVAATSILGSDDAIDDLEGVFSFELTDSEMARLAAIR